MTAKHFIDWEADVFGFGYGTGEPHTVPALKHFLELCGPAGYQSNAVEAKLGPVAGWLMINILCHADIIEYGTSPRFGWLTQMGVVLACFVAGKSADELCELVTSVGHDYVRCLRDHCNCETSCDNPLFKSFKR